ncbi:MAG: archease [Desulfobacteraceae bacterium]|nr:archease [Desulfobacteraceae bacterium]MCF8094850.1 archease [Desulfobacteraceae bacterium]
MPYEVIDHTADTGIRVWALRLEELFAEAARAMFELITDPDHLSFTETRHLQIEGMDLTDLLVNWLRELLLLWNIDQYLIQFTRILDINETKLSAEVFVQPFDPENHVIYTDIKAVTYHGARADRSEGWWKAAIIFDV